MCTHTQSIITRLQHILNIIDHILHVLTTGMTCVLTLSPLLLAFSTFWTSPITYFMFSLQVWHVYSHSVHYYSPCRWIVSNLPETKENNKLPTTRRFLCVPDGSDSSVDFLPQTPQVQVSSNIQPSDSIPWRWHRFRARNTHSNWPEAREFINQTNTNLTL